jgi:hypothetical protein
MANAELDLIDAVQRWRNALRFPRTRTVCYASVH